MGGCCGAADRGCELNHDGIWGWLHTFHPITLRIFSCQRDRHFMPGREPAAFSPTLPTTGGTFAGFSSTPRELGSCPCIRAPAPIDPLKLCELLRSCLPQLEKNSCMHPFLGIDS